MPVKVSVIIITRDAAKTLERCLVSAAWADERIVVDSGSTDGTVELARRLGARVVSHPWSGYAAQKNHALSLATGEWVISLDADEWLTEELSRTLRARLTASGPENGWHVPMKTYYFGRWLRHGGFWPDDHLRVVRRRSAQFISRGKAVHEGLHVEGPTGRLAEPIAHEAYPTLYGYFGKFNRYTELEMEGWVASGRPLYGYDMLIRPVHRWVKRYLWQAGWRDGVPGLLGCSVAAAYEWVTALKVYERQPISVGAMMSTVFKRSGRG